MTAIFNYVNPKDIFEVHTSVDCEVEGAFSGNEICPVCGEPIGYKTFLWTVAEGINTATDIMIHEDCVKEYRRTQFSFWFRSN